MLNDPEDFFVDNLDQGEYDGEPYEYDEFDDMIDEDDFDWYNGNRDFYYEDENE